MSFNADRTITPTSKLILNYLNGQAKPQSVIAISDAVGASYWTVRVLSKTLVRLGFLTLTLNGKSPRYSVAGEKTHPDQESRN